jgi:hypothetical protein
MSVNNGAVPRTALKNRSVGGSIPSLMAQN